jgi:DNA repair exonuclease SbcCD ATPase subunit
MTIDEICENIIREVCKSKLDFQLNQTPYSLYFSIRKKFVRGYKRENQIKPKSPQPLTHKTKLFKYKKEYSQLYDLYQKSVENESNLRTEISRLSSELEIKDDLKFHAAVKLEEHEKVKDLTIKGLKSDKNEFEAKYAQQCSEIKALKDEIDDLKKDKHAASVANKRVKKEQSELNQSHDKKVKILESQIIKLEEFRSKKLAEDRKLK